MKKSKFRPVGIDLKPTTSKLGTFIRKRRLHLKMTQSTVAAHVGVYTTVVSKLERGMRHTLEDAEWQKLAMILQVDAQELRDQFPELIFLDQKPKLGIFIRTRRESLGLSLPDLAKKMKMSVEYVEMLETGPRKELRHKEAVLLAKALKLAVSELVAFTIRVKQTDNRLGLRVRTRRLEIGLSQVELAKKLKASRQFVSQIELGKTRLSDGDGSIACLAEALRLPVRELVALRPNRKVNTVMPASDPVVNFLQKRRIELGLTQRELAKLVNVSPKLVSLYERGSKLPDVGKLYQFAEALRCEVPEEFLGTRDRQTRGC